MLLILATLFVHAAVATPFPPPTGPYNVGYTRHVLNRKAPDDTVVQTNLSLSLLATVYYPILAIPVPGENTASYLDHTTAQIWGDNWQLPNGSLQSLTTSNICQAPPFDAASQKPTVVFSPGAGENAVMYNALNSELASQGYTVVALDHPGDPYLQLSGGASAVHGIDIKAEWNATFAETVYHLRVADIIATVKDIFPAYVKNTGAPFNTTHYFAVGYSLGGAATAGAMAFEPAILGGVNFDCTFFEIPDVKKPILMLGQEALTPNVSEPTRPWFSGNQTGWLQWLHVGGSNHQNFADLDDWVDLLGLRNKTAPLSVGAICALEMNIITKTLVGTFFGSVLGENKWIHVPHAAFPEVEYVKELAVLHNCGQRND